MDDPCAPHTVKGFGAAVVHGFHTSGIRMVSGSKLGWSWSVSDNGMTVCHNTYKVSQFMFYCSSMFDAPVITVSTIQTFAGAQTYTSLLNLPTKFHGDAHQT